MAQNNRDVIKKNGIYFVVLVGGEPTLRPDVIQLFCNELPRRVSVVTNAIFPPPIFENLYYYWVSLDGTEDVHDKIRGKDTYNKTKRNILQYIAGPSRRGPPAWKDIWISVTVNSLNYHTVEELTEEWHGKVNKIAYQFHTPFAKGDPLWLPYGEERNKVIDKMISLKNRYPDFVINDIKQLSLLKGNWGGVGTTPINCPSWIILPLDHMGKIKQPCCIGSADRSAIKPICEDCGLACYSVFLARGFRGNQ
jgi:MoaA/NifB/PqqE/SkfB family radical SAM enzyme